MRWLIIGIAVLTFAVAGAGCGGGDDEASGDTTAITDTTTDETTTDETTTEDTDTEDTDTDGADTDFGDLSGECLEAVQAYSAAFAAAGAGGNSGDTLEVFQEFADRAPEEIRADFQVLAVAYARYVDEVGDVGVQPGETPSAADLAKLSRAAAAFNDPEVIAANERVSAWADENC